MKIVDLKTFLAMPENTVFSKYTPNVFDAPCIKEKSCPEIDDFYYTTIGVDVEYVQGKDSSYLIDKSVADGSSVAFEFDDVCRDGCFDDEQLFAVWDKQDIEQLIAKLQSCLTAHP